MIWCASFTWFIVIVSRLLTKFLNRLGEWHPINLYFVGTKKNIILKVAFFVSWFTIIVKILSFFIWNEIENNDFLPDFVNFVILEKAWNQYPVFSILVYNFAIFFSKPTVSLLIQLISIIECGKIRKFWETKFTMCMKCGISRKMQDIDSMVILETSFHVWNWLKIGILFCLRLKKNKISLKNWSYENDKKCSNFEQK